MDSERKFCPSCGSAATAIKGNYYDENPGYRGVHGYYYVVVCDNCEYNSGEYETPEEALRAWNRRVVGNCKDCNFWNLDNVPKHHAPDGWGWCNLINGLSAANNKAYAISEDVVTAPDYGCIQFEAKQ